MKKETLFSNEIFDEKIFNDTKKKYELMSEQLPDLLASISAEGLPTDWKFIDTITHNEGAFREWVEEQGKERQKGKFLTVSEIQRNADELNEFYNRLAPDVNAIRRMRIERLPMVAVDDSVAVDLEKIDELAKKEATTKIDATKMQNYWEQVNKVVQAINDLKGYEEKNGLPDSTFNPASISMGMDGIYMASPNLSITQFRDKYATPEQFQNIFINTFKKN
ncbi:MAG TPA: hypothetical protein PLH60_08630 [Proteiniphilum sp.]|nr:hypothetical protein [Proteiniphilum sp.]HPJ50971.1 hypothetical protein [Proteiniphilum sp.]HPR20607.1 hypothetical protein [Proteiniphilum sp.]